MRKPSMNPRDGLPQDARLRHRCGGSMRVGDGECWAACCEPPYTEVFSKRGTGVGLHLGHRAAQLHHLRTKTSVFQRPFAKVGALSIAKLPADSSRDLGIMRPDVPPPNPEPHPEDLPSCRGALDRRRLAVLRSQSQP